MSGNLILLGSMLALSLVKENCQLFVNITNVILLVLLVHNYLL